MKYQIQSFKQRHQPRNRTQKPTSHHRFLVQTAELNAPKLAHRPIGSARLNLGQRRDPSSRHLIPPVCVGLWLVQTVFSLLHKIDVGPGLWPGCNGFFSRNSSPPEKDAPRYDEIPIFDNRAVRTEGSIEVE